MLTFSYLFEKRDLFNTSIDPSEDSPELQRLVKDKYVKRFIILGNKFLKTKKFTKNEEQEFNELLTKESVKKYIEEVISSNAWEEQKRLGLFKHTGTGMALGLGGSILTGVATGVPIPLVGVGALIGLIIYSIRAGNIHLRNENEIRKIIDDIIS